MVETLLWSFLFLIVPGYATDFMNSCERCSVTGGTSTWTGEQLQRKSFANKSGRRGKLAASCAQKPSHRPRSALRGDRQCPNSPPRWGGGGGGGRSWRDVRAELAREGM